MRLGIWTPAPLSMRPDAKAQPAIDGLTRHGGGVDKNYLYAVDTLQRAEGELFGNLPPDEPEGGDKDAYIDAVISRAKQLIGETAFRGVPPSTTCHGIP